MNNRFLKLSPVIILFIGLGLRLIAINQSLWLDEAISVQAVTTFNLQNLLLFMKGDYNPPLFNVILYFWLKFFPLTEFFIRLPSIIFGLLTGIFVYKIAKEIFTNHKIALLSLILLITSPLHIFYSQEARMYSLAAFTVSGSMYYFIKLLRSKDSLFIIHYSLFTILMLYSHYLCWPVVLVQLLSFIFLKQFKNKKSLFNFIFAYFLSFLAVVPWLPMLAKQLSVGQSTALGNIMWHQVVGDLSWKNLILIPVKFIIGRSSFDNKIVYGLVMALIISLFGYLIWKAFRVKKNLTFGAKEIVIWLWLILPILLGIIISIKIPVLSYFRFLFCLPAFYLLIAKGIYSLKKSTWFFIIVLIINLFFSLRYLLNTNYYRENWKEAIKVLHQQNGSKAPVLILGNVTAPFDYYDKQESKLVFFEQKELVVNENTIWLIPYAQPIFDPQDMIRQYLNSKGFMRTHEQHFRGVTLEKWQKLVASGYN